MEILPSTFIVFVAIAALMAIGLKRGYWVFFALSPLGAAAAFNLPAVGGASVGIKEFLALVILMLTCMRPSGFDRILGTMRPMQPGFILLILALYCVVSAVFAPSIFRDQTIVFAIARNNNSSSIIQTLLRPSNGNISQLFLLLLSMLTFIAFATLGRLSSDTRIVMKGMIIATVVHIVLGVVDVVSAAVGASQILDPIRTANYSILVDHRMMGLKRMIGGFPEASSFGVFSMGLFGFWLHYVINGKGGGWAKLFLALSLFAVLRSTSSAAYVALALFFVCYGFYFVFGRLRERMSRGSMTAFFVGSTTVVLCIAGVAVAYFINDAVSDNLDDLLFNKLDSQSGVERSSWNTQAFQNFLDTFGFGAGLGSVRGSNWLMASLGNIGFPGTALFITFFVMILRARVATEDQESAVVLASLKLGCVGLFLSDFLIAATPNVGAFFFALAGLIAGHARASVLAQSIRQNAMRFS